jgi:hypothetical protein
VLDTFLLPEVAIAMIVTVPAATPVTRPVPLTEATPEDELLHATVAVKSLPSWSFVLALSCTDCPGSTDCVGAVMETELSTAAVVGPA